MSLPERLEHCLPFGVTEHACERRVGSQFARPVALIDQHTQHRVGTAVENDRPLIEGGHGPSVQPVQFRPPLDVVAGSLQDGLRISDQDGRPLRRAATTGGAARRLGPRWLLKRLGVSAHKFRRRVWVLDSEVILTCDPPLVPETQRPSGKRRGYVAPQGQYYVKFWSPVCDGSTAPAPSDLGYVNDAASTHLHRPTERNSEGPP